MGIPVTIPNESTFKAGYGDTGSCGPTTREGSPITPPNAHISGYDTGSSGTTAKQAGTIHAPNESHKFHTSDAKMPTGPAAIQPGIGAVAIRPNGNGVTSSAKLPDSFMRAAAKK